MADLTMYRGEKKTWTGTITQSGVAVDITGATIKFTVRRVYPAGTISSDADADVIVTKTTAAGITLTTPASGIFTLVISTSDTSTVSIGEDGYSDFLYGCEYAPSGDTTNPRVVAQGKFTMFADIVRA